MTKRRVIVSKRVTDLIVGPLLALCCTQANAYQIAGHFYSVYAAAESTVKLTEPERRLLAFCAQLPDQSVDLDAVAVYRNVVLHHPMAWERWARSNVVDDDSDAVRRMITAQQLIHVLTGGSAAAVQEVAQDVIGNLVTHLDAESGRLGDLCALGFAFHMLGDSFAHQRMDGNRATMYSTGVGHAKDLSYPDYPLCDGFAGFGHFLATCREVEPHECDREKDELKRTRYCRWSLYPVEGARLLSAAPDDGPVLALAGELENLADGADDFNGWEEERSEQTLLTDEKLPPEFEAFFEAHASTEPCEGVLAAAFATKALGLPAAGGRDASAALSCADVWNRFAPIAVAAIRQVEMKETVREPLGNLKWDALYECPLKAPGQSPSLRSLRCAPRHDK